MHDLRTGSVSDPIPAGQPGGRAFTPWALDLDGVVGLDADGRRRLSYDDGGRLRAREPLPGGTVGFARSELAYLEGLPESASRPDDPAPDWFTCIHEDTPPTTPERAALKAHEGRDGSAMVALYEELGWTRYAAAFR